MFLKQQSWSFRTKARFIKKILYFTLATLGEVGKLISPYELRFFVQPSFLNSFFPLTMFLLALFAEGRSLLFSFKFHFKD